MFLRKINWSEGFPNMVLSTECSEAVNARYTFQPLWVSDNTLKEGELFIDSVGVEDGDMNDKFRFFEISMRKAIWLKLLPRLKSHAPVFLCFLKV